LRATAADHSIHPALAQTGQRGAGQRTWRAGRGRAGGQTELADRAIGQRGGNVADDIDQAAGIGSQHRIVNARDVQQVGIRAARLKATLRATFEVNRTAGRVDGVKLVARDEVVARQPEGFGAIAGIGHHKRQRPAEVGRVDGKRGCVLPDQYDVDDFCHVKSRRHNGDGCRGTAVKRISKRRRVGDRRVCRGTRSESRGHGQRSHGRYQAYPACPASAACCKQFHNFYKKSHEKGELDKASMLKATHERSFFMVYLWLEIKKEVKEG